jgi:hypothetical protein
MAAVDGRSAQLTRGLLGIDSYSLPFLLPQRWSQHRQRLSLPPCSRNFGPLHGIHLHVLLAKLDQMQIVRVAFVVTLINLMK